MFGGTLASEPWPASPSPPAPRASRPNRSYAAWKAAAVELMGGRAGTMPEREWKRSFIVGLDPERVAALAETYRRNTVAADRKRKRR